MSVIETFPDLASERSMKPMTKLQRLLFLQGDKCFFCDAPIPEEQASVEHLNATSNGGDNSDENTVVCCRAVNIALGSLSVKEKFRAILSHRGRFACPARAEAQSNARPNKSSASDAQKLLPEVVKNLRERGAARPKKPDGLRNAIAASFQQVSPIVIEDVLILLKDKGYTAEGSGKLSYPRWQSKD